MIKIIITGAKGRMGQAIEVCASRDAHLEVVGRIDKGDDLRSVITQGDVVVDFSNHSLTPEVAGLCAEHKKGLVIGTTGHNDSETFAIKKAIAPIPVVWASNFSTGVNTLFWLTGKAAEILGPDFDLEVVEMHHRHKHDAPSGTAKTLVEILAKARHFHLPQAARHGRQGIVGERPPGEIGIHSLRGGDVVGDHTVVFSTAGERVELAHKASSRETFANGALRAAQWIVKQKPGLYDMQDVLGLK